LRSVDTGKLDLTEWLEYFTGGVAVSVNDVRERILRLSSERLRRDEKGQIALTERQMRIIENLQRKGRTKAGDVAKMFGITRQAALKELRKLVELEVIKLEGRGRGAHYVMT
jgi:Fic family protein